MIASGGSASNFYTLSAAGGSGRYPADVLVGNELIASIIGSPTAGVCRAAQAVPGGSASGTGEQTLCCAP